MMSLYQEGRKNPLADAMSRLQFQSNEADELEATNGYSEINFATCKAISINDFKAEYSTHPLTQTVIMRAISGKWSDCSLQEMPSKELADFPTVENDLVHNACAKCNGFRPRFDESIGPTLHRGNNYTWTGSIQSKLATFS